MTEEVLVSVKGLHSLDNAQEDEVEVIFAGKYYKRNGKHYVLFEEAVEGSSQTVSSRIKLQQERMEVSKKGAVNSQMIFEPDRKSESWYGTPYGNMLAGIQVKNMKIEETRDVIRASVEYSLELNYEHMADCRLQVKIMAKGSESFRLSD